MLNRVIHVIGTLLEVMLIFLMIALTVIVIVAVFYRKVIESSLSWYDEIAAINLIWLTYYGAALAALRRKHIGFDGVLISLPPATRAIAFTLAEFLVIGFFVLLAYAGWQVYRVVEGANLISLTWVPLQLPQSVIPIGAVLFIAAELLSMPEAWRAAMSGLTAEQREAQEELAKV